MSDVRVYELARDLKVESRAVMGYLNAEGHFVRSASSPLPPEIAHKVRAHFLSPTGSRHAPLAPTGAPNSPPVTGAVSRTPTRVVDIATRLQLRSMDVLKELRAMGCPVKNFSSTVDLESENRLRAAHGFPPAPRPAPKSVAPGRAWNPKEPPRPGRNPLIPSSPARQPEHRSPSVRPAQQAPGRDELVALFGTEAVDRPVENNAWRQAWTRHLFLPEDADHWIAAGLDRTEYALASSCVGAGIEPRHLLVRDDDGLTVLHLLRRGHSPEKIVATGLLERG